MNPKLMLAVGLAAATFVLFLTVIAGGGALRAGLAPWPGIGAIVMAAVAFAVSRGQRSYLVAGLLAAGGLVGLVYGMMATEFFSAVVFSGPILGVVIGLPILGLGVAKGVEAARTGSRTTA
jgi:hypothetical protein